MAVQKNETHTTEKATSLFPRIGNPAKSLDERIVDEIRGLIQSGKLQPGDRLPSERALSQEMGVSRASLRGALRRLSTMGLVDIRWGQGVFIRSTDLDLVLDRLVPMMLRGGHISELYEIRRVLEVTAAEWAAGRATRAERAELKVLTEDAIANRESLVGNADLAVDFDRRYHNLIAVLSHNPVLMRIMMSLLDLLGELRQRSFTNPKRAGDSLEEHRLLTDAIVSGNMVAAREQMLEHLKNAEASVQGILQAAESVSND